MCVGCCASLCAGNRAWPLVLLTLRSAHTSPGLLRPTQAPWRHGYVTRVGDLQHVKGRQLESLEQREWTPQVGAEGFQHPTRTTAIALA